jgi:hypothetical protein
LLGSGSYGLLRGYGGSRGRGGGFLAAVASGGAGTLLLLRFTNISTDYLLQLSGDIGMHFARVDGFGLNRLIGGGLAVLGEFNLVEAYIFELGALAGGGLIKHGAGHRGDGLCFLNGGLEQFLENSSLSSREFFLNFLGQDLAVAANTGAGVE